MTDMSVKKYLHGQSPKTHDITGVQKGYKDSFEKEMSQRKGTDDRFIGEVGPESLPKDRNFEGMMDNREIGKPTTPNMEE
jgi:hypothetical protein